MPNDLFEQHRLIAAAARDLTGALDPGARIAFEELNRYRMRLGGLLMRHKIAEEEQIFGPLFRDRWIDDLPQIKQCIDQVRARKQAYSECIQQWTPLAIDLDWPGYVATVKNQIDIWIGAIRIEEDEIYRPVMRYRAARDAQLATPASLIAAPGPMIARA